VIFWRIDKAKFPEPNLPEEVAVSDEKSWHSFELAAARRAFASGAAFQI
jgi:hypothetical protein